MNARESELELIRLVQTVDAAEPGMGPSAFARYLKACAEIRPLVKAQRRAIAAKDDAEVTKLDGEIAAAFQAELKRIANLMSEEPPF